MKTVTALQNRRDLTSAFAAALILHIVVLYGLSSYHFPPPQREDLTIFVSTIDTTAPPKVIEPLTPEVTPVRHETKRTSATETAKILQSHAPAVSPPTSKSETVAASTTPAVKEPPATIAPPASSRAVNIPAPTVTTPQSVINKDELSVSCVERTAPIYPRVSTRLGEQGKTVLLVELDEQGVVTNIKVKTTSWFQRLDEAAINAVKTWRCTPAKRNGVAVRSTALQPFNFTLKGR